MAHPGGRPPIFKTAKDMRLAIEAYLEECKNDYRPYTIIGLALSIGMTRETLCQYAKQGEFSDTVSYYKQLVQRSVEERLFNASCTGAIFWMKNNAGWKDQTDLSLQNPDGSKLDLTVNFVTPKAD